MSLLAHAGGTGWDEILMAVLPLIASGGIFLAARHRLQRRRLDDEAKMTSLSS